MSEERKGTMLSLKKDLVERAKIQGLNMSQIMNETLNHVLEHGTYQPVRTELFLCDLDIQRIENQILSYKEYLVEMQTQLEELIRDRINIEQMVRKADEDTDIAMLYQRLSDIAKANNYYLNASWDGSRKIRKEFANHALEFTKETFKAYIERLK